LPHIVALSGSRCTFEQDLKLELADGRSITAAGGLEKKEAEWFRAELKKDLA
jgi:hypothetical protein